jgi:hypothetical protein
VVTQTVTTVREIQPWQMTAEDRLEEACDIAEAALGDLKATRANAKARSDMRSLQQVLCAERPPGTGP